MGGGLLRWSLLRGRRSCSGRRDHHRRGLTAGLLRLRRGRGGGQRGREPDRRDFVGDISHQKLNRAITSMVRIVPALVTRPNDEDPVVAESPENAGVFVRFWTSQRISR